MQATEAVRQYAQMKLVQLVEACKGKEIPNWYQIEDQVGFGIRITEGDLNFQVNMSAYPIDEQEGAFLINMNASFMSKPVARNGFEFMPMPLAAVMTMDFQLCAETEQELQDGMLQLISDEAENILCRILQ